MPIEDVYDYVSVEGNTGANYVIKKENNSSKTKEKSNVDYITIESLIKKIGIDKILNSIIKIDIEGGEPDLIEKFIETLKLNNNRLPIFAFECLNASEIEKQDQ